MNFLKTGRLFFGIGIISYGLQQIIIRDFRPEILAGFPDWMHQYSIIPIFTGVIMSALGLIISGVFNVKESHKRNICQYLGLYFLFLLIFSHIPYLLFVYPHKLSHLGSWGDFLKGLAFCGGAFVMAGSFLPELSIVSHDHFLKLFLNKLIPFGRIFFCATIILYGCNHFVYDLSFMVPKWFVFQNFWSYFGGAALIGSGIAILVKVFVKPVSLLLALMLFLWFLMLHIPGAILNPTLGRGNLIVSAFDALLFSGIALVLSESIQKKGALFFKNIPITSQLNQGVY